MDKSHVSMEQKVCMVCGIVHDSGAILLRKDLRQTLDRKTITGMDICGDCDTKLPEYIALVEVEARKGWERTHMNPEEARRTGRLMWVKREAFKAIFNASDEQDGRKLPLVWVAAPEPGEPNGGTIDMLAAMHERDTGEKIPTEKDDGQ